MAHQFQGKKIAILVADGFEQVELTSPREALEKAGAATFIVSPNRDKVQGWNHAEKGDSFEVDLPLDEADAGEYNALLLPGGVMNPDKLRTNEKAITFVRDFFKQGKPVAAICHGPWTLINAEVVEGRKMTSYHSIRVDLENAGAEWVDEPVVVDQGLVTSRHPDDLKHFNNKLLEEVEEGKHAGQHA